ncbi:MULTISPECIES: hypothetical protein [Variovorax]|uniref:hypothetical protein n=1 Tax=Variovorax TaxID=34072 RepID=UPI002862DF03|nr:hypothetical protein [Variovorax sp. 3319]MDR6887906.1 hypothetical protein [Variovorax sp. 3319]
MSTYYASHGFSTNDVSGAFAVGVLRDLHVNAHAFQGFPSISIRDTEDGFDVWLELGGLTSAVLTVPFKEGKKLAKDFQKKRELSSEWMGKLQTLLAAMEGAYGSRKRAEGVL